MATRRQILRRSAAITATTWVAPSIIALDRVAAAAPSDTSCEVPAVVDGAVWLDPPPTSLLEGGPLDSNANTYVFSETPAPVTLTAPLVVNRVTAGSFGGNSNENASIAVGTTICSYFVHGDRLDDRGWLYGSLSFANSQIIGLIYRSAQMSASSFLEVPTTTYDIGPMESNDSMGFDLTPGANALRWEMRFGGHLDQIRVITTC